jgi:hypothetical protein
LSLEGDIGFNAARRHPDELATKEHKRSQRESMQVLIYVIFALQSVNVIQFREDLAKECWARPCLIPIPLPHIPVPLQPFPKARRQSKKWRQKNLLFLYFASIFLPSGVRLASRSRSILNWLRLAALCSFAANTSTRERGAALIGCKRAHKSQRQLQPPVYAFFAFLRGKICSTAIWCNLPQFTSVVSKPDYVRTLPP